MLAVLATLALPAASQPESDSDLYDGRWTATVQDSEAGYTRANVLIRDFAGTWQDRSPAKGPKRACAGKRFKITVQRSRPSELEFTVFGTSVSTECPDLGVQLKPVDDKTLEGRFGTSGRITLKRSR